MPVVLINNSQETFTPTQSGAIATWVWEVCQSARRTGHYPWVITRGSHAPMYDWPQTHAIPYPAEPRNSLENVLRKADRKLFGYTEIGMRNFGERVIRLIRERQLDSYPLMLQNDLELAVLLRQAFPRATIIHHFHNQSGCKARFSRHVARSCSVITAVSRHTGQWVETQFGLPIGSVKTIHNGVDSERFAPADEPPVGPPVINFHGKTTFHKAPDLLLSAALILAERTTEFSLQMIGSNFWHKFEMDDYQQKLLSQLQQLHNRKIMVRRIGHMPRAQIPLELQRSRIHCVPSRWDEPFGLVTLEGMACGLATVASDTGATSEVLGEAGLLFERDNAQSLADQLWKLLVDPELLRELAQQGRTRAELFTWDACWQAIRSVLSSTDIPTKVPTELKPLRGETLSRVS
jgi:glycosyltransferase involved in cell wall biosynthesis